MGQVIKHYLVTQTDRGEITINLNLNISVNNDGSVNINAAANVPEKVKLFKPEAEEEIPRFLIPDFEQGSEILADFGEDVGG